MQLQKVLGFAPREIVRMVGGTEQPQTQWVAHVLTADGEVELEEDPKRRSLTAKLYPWRDDQGRLHHLECVVMGAAHYRPNGVASGEPWLDRDLRPSSVAALYHLAYPQGNKAHFSYRSRDGGEDIEFALLDVTPLYNWANFEDVGPGPNWQPSEEDRRIWRDVFPGVDLVLQIWPDQIALRKVIKDDKARHEFRHTLSVSKDGQPTTPRKLRTEGAELTGKAEIESALARGDNLREAFFEKAGIRPATARQANGNPAALAGPTTRWTGNVRTETLPTQDKSLYPLVLSTYIGEVNAAKRSR